MLHLRQVIDQLEPEEIEFITSELLESKASKVGTLFSLLRENQLSDGEILDQLRVNQNAFYVLKSRLFDKIQGFLLKSISSTDNELINKSILIPDVEFRMPRGKAIAILTKLEKEFLEYDLPYELTSVYSALKRLHSHSEKHYTYTQLYNKHVAYTLSLDKAEDLLSNFMKSAGNYLSSKDEQHLATLPLIKSEIAHISTMYESHHLQIFKGICEVTAALFLPLEEATREDAPVEDQLTEMDEIIKKYPKDISYKYIRHIVHFLWFEYYHRFGVEKKARQYFTLVDKQFPYFLNYNNLCLCSQFLLSRLAFSQSEGIAHLLKEQNEHLFSGFPFDSSDVYSYSNTMLSFAVANFIVRDFPATARVCNQLLNELSFKHHSHSEIEVKLILAMSDVAATKYERAWNTLRSLYRKIKSIGRMEEYKNVNLMIKLLRSIINQPGRSVSSKQSTLLQQFNLLNKGEYAVLPYLQWDQSFLAILSGTTSDLGERTNQTL